MYGIIKNIFGVFHSLKVSQERKTYVKKYYIIIKACIVGECFGLRDPTWTPVSGVTWATVVTHIIG